LKNITDDLTHLVDRQLPAVGAGQQNLSLLRPQQPVEVFDQGRFSAAVRAQDRNKLSFPDTEIDSIQDFLISKRKPQSTNLDDLIPINQGPRRILGHQPLNRFPVHEKIFPVKQFFRRRQCERQGIPAEPQTVKVIAERIRQQAEAFEQRHIGKNGRRRTIGDNPPVFQKDDPVGAGCFFGFVLNHHDRFHAQVGAAVRRNAQLPQ